MNPATVPHYLPALGGPSDAEVSHAEEVLQQRKDALVAQAQGTLVRCTGSILGKGCGNTTPIHQLTYIQTHYYIDPIGCSGGDYWLQGEGRFRCLHCGNMNRLYASPKVEKLKPHFKSIHKTYHNDG